MDFLDDETRKRAVLEFISREIHMGEACSSRHLTCTGTSTTSEKAALAALRAIRHQGLAIVPANEVPRPSR